MKNQKGFINIAVVAIVLVAVAISGYFVFVRNMKVAIAPTPSPSVSTSPTPDGTAGWKTYKNTQYGFEFKYPSDWNIDESIEKGTIFGDLPTTTVTNKNQPYSFEEGIEYPTWSVSYTKDVYGSSIDTYMSKFNLAVRNLPRKITQDIDNQTTYVIQGITAPVYHDFRIVFKNGYVFDLEGPKSNDIQDPAISAETVNLITQILSTFKFTK